MINCSRKLIRLRRNRLAMAVKIKNSWISKIIEHWSNQAATVKVISYQGISQKGTKRVSKGRSWCATRGRHWLAPCPKTGKWCSRLWNWAFLWSTWRSWRIFAKCFERSSGPGQGRNRYNWIIIEWWNKFHFIFVTSKIMNIYLQLPDDSRKMKQLCAHIREIGHSEYRQRFNDWRSKRWNEMKNSMLLYGTADSHPNNKIEVFNISWPR